MHLVNNKFKNLKKKGVWNTPRKEEDNTIALRASLEKLKKEKPRV